MVGLVIAFPAMVMHYKGVASTVDPNTIKIEVPQIELPPLDFGPAGQAIATMQISTDARQPRSFRSGVSVVRT